MSALKKFASVLLALLVGILTPLPVAFAAPGAAAQAVCHCCTSKQTSCRTAACCAQRAEHSPVAPAASATQQNEWQSLAPAITIFDCPATSSTSLRPHTNFLPSAPALAIFVRDCSYLI